MRIYAILSAAAMSMAVMMGSASAAERFATLEGVTADRMSLGELAAVKGMHRHFLDANGELHIIPAPLTLEDFSPDGNNVIQAYRGLCVAPPIGIPFNPTTGPQCP